MSKKLFVGMVLICFILGNAPQASALEARDVPVGHWAATALRELNGHGVMQGYEGFFRPDDEITRAEYAALINRTFGFKKTAPESVFADSGSDLGNWKDLAIMQGAYQGYLKGENGYARPDRNITREEAMVIISRVLKQEATEGNTDFSDDGRISPWAKGNITAMWREGYVSGSGGKLDPGSNLSRAEAAQLLYNTTGELLDQAQAYDMENKVFTNVTISV